MEIRNVNFSNEAIHSSVASEQFKQSACKIKDRMSSCQECKIQNCCNGIGEFFSSIWQNIIGFFKWIFCCGSAK